MMTILPDIVNLTTSLLIVTSATQTTPPSSLPSSYNKSVVYTSSESASYLSLENLNNITTQFYNNNNEIITTTKPSITSVNIVNNTNNNVSFGGGGAVGRDNNEWSNRTHNDDIINNGFIQATFCVLYTNIFVLGIFGNVLVCYVVFRNKAMQTVTNLFITNLALSDILLCGLAVPFTPLYTFLRGWVFGTVLCHLVPYAQGCSVYISTLTLTSIAIDRFFVIIYPFHPRMKLSTCILIIISIWVISLLITSPYGFYVKLYPSNYTGTITVYCEEDWPDEEYRKVFGAVTSSLQFLLPFVIISICYVCVSFKLNDRMNTRPGSRNSRREEADRDRKKRTNRMLIAMVAIFGISWLPINVVNIFNDFYSKSEEWRYYTVIFFIAHCTAMSSTCYNPFLYAWLNENFRKEFKQVLPCFSPSLRGVIRKNGTNTQSHLNLDNMCNGNNETCQESILQSTTQNNQIIPRGPTANDNDCLTSVSMSKSIPVKLLPQTVDEILLSDVKPTILAHETTTILPAGVLETQFDIPPATFYTNNVIMDNLSFNNKTHDILKETPLMPQQKSATEPPLPYRGNV